MKQIIINGGRPLFGEVSIKGAKNAALPIFAASLLTEEDVYLKDIPDIKDVRTMAQMLKALGKSVEKVNDVEYVIRQHGSLNFEAPYELVRQMRASFLVLGPLLARKGHAKVSLPGGCVIGARPVDLHLKGLRALGAEIQQTQGFVEARAQKLKPAEIYLDYPSVGATEQLMMAAATIPEKTVILNPAQEPEVYDLARFLQKMGACVQLNHSRLEIEGTKQLRGTEHTIIPDRINAGTFLIAAAITSGELFVHCNPMHLQALLMKLREMGAEVEEKPDGVNLQGKAAYKPIEVETRPYPGLATDHQPQIVALLSLAKGESIVRETVFENRFLYTAELARMGADITVRGQTVVIRGVEHLEGATVQADDLRAGAALVLAGLAAHGTTVVLDAGHIERGYSDLAGQLKGLGADIIVKESVNG